MRILHREVSSDYALAVIEGESGFEYTVMVEPDYDSCSCGCPDFAYRQHLCKHLRFFLDYLSLVRPEWIDQYKSLMEEETCRKKQKESDSSEDHESPVPLNQYSQ